LSSHALATTGTGGTAALSKTQIGSDLTLPAGGPWTIFGIWGMVVKNTTVPDEGSGGALIIDALSGDLSPDPAPGEYPLIGANVSESANAAISPVPLIIYPVNWKAEGKALISLTYLNQLAITTGSDVAAGILFGDSIPEKRPLVFCDGVRSAFASTAEQEIGTIVISEKAKRIVGILADCNKGDAATAGEPILATIRLNSADIKFAPAQYPCNRGFNASDGTAVGQSATPMSQFIPVDIPVIGGTRVDVLATSTASVTGNVEVQVYLAYE